MPMSVEAPSTLRILAASDNERGDLFARLVSDLFFALGYMDFRLNVHKSGREIDIQGNHRFEPRRMVAECKAHSDKMGGSELNKFLGALTRERHGNVSTPVAGYFVSLSGFTETAREQELATDAAERLILLDARDVIRELVRCHVLVDHTTAAEHAGRCAQHAQVIDGVLSAFELLGHNYGYIWVVYYGHGKQPTHFSLVHADGTALAMAVAREVIDLDHKLEGTLHCLEYLAPPLPAPSRQALAVASVDRYHTWLEEECGYIQLDGLPADAELSAMRMRLERLFVPLKVVEDPRWKNEVGDDPKHVGGAADESIVDVGTYLNNHSRFALLATPGGGKSTLLKRLAIAYARPARRTELADLLPERHWLPLFLRCRELRDRANRPIRELLSNLARHAGMNVDEEGAFAERIDEALRSGQALLLVDGLDEISPEGALKEFVLNLRTFVAMFPQTALVVTSREAGFRHVAGVVAGVCPQVTLAPFDYEDVERLCQSWHAEVVGRSEKIRSDARELAETIWGNERIRDLAENPLLLTTLLVVKRWIGELPRRRVELYRKAVEVLIRTWNVEGYEPLDEDETLAQLSYVACAMMNDGAQRIGHRSLLELLQDARRELEEELQFARISPQEFIDRIEYRSSILMQTGHELLDDELQAVYEFRHLTFQEYMVARGLVEQQYPGRADNATVADLLGPHFAEQRWREVIPLAAVLAGRRAEELIRRLTVAVEDGDRRVELPDGPTLLRPTLAVLRQCLFDEVQVTPATLRGALKVAGRKSDAPGLEQFVDEIKNGKFASVFFETIRDAYLSDDEKWEDYAGCLAQLEMRSVFPDGRPMMSEEVAEAMTALLSSLNRADRCAAALVWMECAYGEATNRWRSARPETERQRLGAHFAPIRDRLGELLSQKDPQVALAAAWALAWVGKARLPPTPPRPDLILSLYSLWRTARSTELARFAQWAFGTQPVSTRDAFWPGAWGDCSKLFENVAIPTVYNTAADDALAVLSWYRRGPWSDSDLVTRIKARELEYRRVQSDGSRPLSKTARELLTLLGTEGTDAMQELDKNS
jgi:hypothetical protein